jgi:hypothetical protein
MFAPESTWRLIGQVGRLIAFEKGTKYERAPWLTDYMVQYDSHAHSKDGRKDPWLWWAWGFGGDKELSTPRAYGKSEKKHYEEWVT